MNEIIGNKKKGEILAEKILTMNYGDIIRHNDIAALIKEDYGSNKYTTTIKNARKILLKNGRYIESIIGEGYRIVKPDDITHHSLKRYKRGFNELQKGFDILENAPVNDMTPEGRDTHARVYDRAVGVRASIKGFAVELKTLGEKKHPFALENIQK